PLSVRPVLMTMISKNVIHILACVVMLGSLNLRATDHVLRYDEPGRWEPITEGLPVGNGRLGALVMGGTEEERIVLNEDTLWAGGPYDPSRPGAALVLPKIRELIFQDRHADAQALTQDAFMSQPMRQMSYQAMADLLMHLPGHSQPTGYARSL